MYFFILVKQFSLLGNIMLCSTLTKIIMKGCNIMTHKNNFFRGIRTLRNKLNFPILKQPKQIKALKGKIIAISIIATLLLDAMSFSLKGSQAAMNAGLVPLSIFMLVLYFSQRILETSYSTYADLQNDIFRQIFSDETIQIVMNICNMCRSKVFKKEDGKECLMENAEIMQKSQWYLSAVWEFWWRIPVTISECIILAGMIVGMIIVEIHDSDPTQTTFIMTLLIICIIVYFVLGKKRIILKKDYRKLTKEAESKKDVLLTEIKSIDFISKSDFDYHAEQFRDHLMLSTEINKKERLKLNNVFIQRSFIASGFMITILLFKVFTAQTLDISVILNVVAVSSVYSTILSKIGNILHEFETLADNIIDINTLYPDFNQIHNVYMEEARKNFSANNVEEITVGKFYATQDPKKRYLLKNASSFSLSKGDFALVQGPTGCGKSTLLMLLTGKLRIKNNPIVFNNGENGYLQSISYQTDKAMANGFVINELILDNDPDQNTDYIKLFDILHGLHLYDELLRMATSDTDINLSNLSDDDKVFNLLKQKTTKQFSSGQQQRLALAKLLYTMSDIHQVIALDEAFNRLDDITAKQCIEFVYNYTQKDMPRIVLLATHQVDLVRPICNKEISFVADLNTSLINVRNITSTL